MISNIAIIGIGGIGGYIGGMLAHYYTHRKDFNISFVARGNNFTSILNNGLNVILPDKKINCKPTFITDKINQLNNPDLVILCIKSYDLDEVTIELKNTIKPNTIILPLLNGIDITNRIKKNLPNSIIMPACIYINSHLDKPGEVLVESNKGLIISGKDIFHPNIDFHSINDIFQNADIFFKLVDNIDEEIWKKYIFVASFAITCAAYKCSFKEILTDKEKEKTLQTVFEEIKEIAKSIDVYLPENFYEQSLKRAEQIPLGSKPSYLRDLEKGVKTESDIFIKTLLDIAAKNKISINKIEELWEIIKKRYKIIN